MIRRMTLVTLALALMTTLAAPVAWGQTFPTERGSDVDPNGQPSATVLSGFGSTDLSEISSSTLGTTREADRSPAQDQRTAPASHGLLASLMLHFLAQAIGV